MQHQGMLRSHGGGNDHGGSPVTHNEENREGKAAHSSRQVQDGGTSSALESAFRQLQGSRGLDPNTVGSEEGTIYHMFRRDADFLSATIHARTPFEERAQVAQAWSARVESIMGIYPIRHRPADFPVDGSLVAIIKWDQDDDERPFAQDILALIDVEVHSGQEGDTSRRLYRKVSWQRHQTNRQGILMALSLYDYCHLRVNDRCLLWHNNQLWPLQDGEDRTLRNGDYFRVAVPAEDGMTSQSMGRFLLAAERALRGHITFHFSDTSDSNDEGLEESESETRYGRPESVSEPEPHDNLDIEFQPDILQELCETTSGASEHGPWLMFHGLPGCAAGVVAKQCDTILSVEKILALADAAWPNQVGGRRALHVVHPQPQWSSHCTWHFIVEYRPKGWSTLCTPILHQKVTYKDHALETTLYAGYDWWGEYGQAGALVTDIDDCTCEQRVRPLQTAQRPSYRVQVFAAETNPEEGRVYTFDFPREVVWSPFHLARYCALALHPTKIEDLVIVDEIPGDETIYVLDRSLSSSASLCFIFYDTEERNKTIQVTPYFSNPIQVFEHFGISPSQGHCEIHGSIIHVWTQLQPARERAREVSYPLGTGWKPPPSLEGQPFERPQSRPTAINLESCLEGDQYKPRRTWNGPKACGLDFRPVFDLWAWLDSSCPMVQWSLPEGRRWHPATMPWLASWWDLNYADEIYVYTDGSANGSLAASAAVFFIRVGYDWHYGGYLRQHLNGDPCSHRAELQGIMLGFHWINATLHRLSYTQAKSPKVTFAFDSTSAGFKAFGQWSGGQYPDLTGALRSLHYFLEARFNFTILYEHVYGHRAHPGNEAANTAAQLAGNADLEFPSVWTKHFDTAISWEVHWLWTIWKPEWREYWRDGFLCLPEHPVTMPAANLFDATSTSGGEDSTAGQPAELTDCVCKVATANVLTLLPSERHGGLIGQACTEMLQRLFLERGYHIVGVQETRQKKECKIDQADFYTFSAAANPRGQFGIQIWIAKNLTLGDAYGKFERHHFKIIARAPRWLILRVAAPFLRLLIVCGHAPTSQASDDDISTWWSMLAKSIPRKYTRWPQLLLVDANARLGSQVSDAVGGHQAEEQDHSGCELHQYLERFDLWIPSTFGMHQKGDGGTWCHPRTELWSRGDYVGLPKAWRLTKCEAYVDMKVDLSLKREDHRVAGAEFAWQGRKEKEGPRPKSRTPIDVDRLRDHLQGETRLETLDDLLNYIPEVGWDTDVHTHTALLQGGLQRWLQRHYIRGRKKPRRRMSQETWELVCAKKACRDRLFQHKTLLRRRVLQACWAIWTGRSGDYVIETADEAHDNAVDLRDFRNLGMKVTYALRKDDKTFFEEMAAETGLMDAPGRSRDFWRRIRGAFPKFKHKATTSPLTIDALDSQWLPHFAQLEAGRETTASQLLTKCFERQDYTPGGIELTLQDLPTRHEVETILRSLQPNKASGPDGIPGDLYRGAASGLAEHVHGLFSKMTWWCSEPIQAKGGHMFPILKRGDPAIAGSYRGVMLNVLSKAYHRWLREKLMVTLNVIRLDTQIGGFQGQQATFGAHAVQTTARIAHAAGCPMACLFVDIQGAYHFLVRELVMGHNHNSQDDIEAALQNLEGWSANTKGLQQWLKLPGILERARFPKWLINIIREVHTDTWAQMPTLSSLLRTSRGSRPGSPLADVVFAAIMFDLHVEVYRILEETPEVVAGYKKTQLEPLAVTWADDLAIPMILESNEVVIPALRMVLRRTFQAFERRGLLLNLQKGKTTAVIAFRGAGAPAFRKEFLLQSNPGTFVDIDPRRRVWLHFSSAYKHLGALFIPAGEVQCEIQSRLGQARSAYMTLRRFLFGNRKISVKTRLQLFESLIASRLCYGLCSWGHIAPRQFQSLEAFIHKCQRYICEGSFEGGSSFEILTSRYKFCNLQQRLAYARITYAMKLWTVGPMALQELVRTEAELTETSWWHYLEEDLRWCQRLAGPLFPAEDLQASTLTASWRRNPSAWKRAIKRALKVGVLQEATASDVRGWHNFALQTLTNAGVQIQGHHAGDLGGNHFQCQDCERSFTSIQGLTAHRRFKHGYQAPEAKWTQGIVTCRVCMKYLWTKARLQQRLSYMPRDGRPNSCYAHLCKYGDPHAAQDESEGGQNGTSFGATYGVNRREALQAQGPLPEPRAQAAHAYEVKRQQWEQEKEAYEKKYYCPDELYDEIVQGLTEATQDWFQRGVDDATVQLAKHELQDAWLVCVTEETASGAFSRALLRWGRELLPDIYAEWMSGYGEQIAEDAFSELLPETDIYEDEQKLQDLERKVRAGYNEMVVEDEDPLPHRAVRRGPQQRQGGHKSIKPHIEKYNDDDGWHARWCDFRLEYGIKDQAMPFYRTLKARPIYLVLHLFSGRRREEDIHWYLASMAQSASFDIHVLSLDTAINKTVGNLAWTGSTWARVLELLRAGRISSGIAGPPCETYSAARYNEPPSTHDEQGRIIKWPRPLRDAQRPWGIPERTPKELKQLYVGSQLALQVMIVMIFLLVQGGSFINEHPGPPEAEWKASLYKTPLVAPMLQFPEVALRIVNQGDYGAISTKPTGLLALRMPHLMRSLLRWRHKTPREQRVEAIGVDSKGRFKTARLKEYPSYFAHGLAQAVYDSIQSHHRRGETRGALLDDETPVAFWLSEALQINTRICEAEMQPDYQPQNG